MRTLFTREYWNQPEIPPLILVVLVAYLLAVAFFG